LQKQEKLSLRLRRKNKLISLFGEEKTPFDNQ